MLQSFLLINEFENAGCSPPAAHRAASHTARSESVPEATLLNMGFRVYTGSSAKELALLVPKADAALLYVPPEQVESWRKRVLALRSLPILWWCDSHSFPSRECRMDAGIDGMLGTAMSELEIHCALLLGVNHYFRRTEWEQEREQLLSRLEERKWVDQAKRILSEVKRITEAEAYDFLRKQAMNERKRVVDIATSIVKVYQLLQEENKGGRRR
ncbi:ANTAR domain-containing response regulator [Paenibacillus piri]|uniref:ANTAR domain-containing protein n=1 Tax=Paenibacillus piri TaxID=2547395 RepID=A0A4R5K6M8_9BACL|nr:ANTAR domain-containing protein [Paenibacillus piri]TDF88907.1 ANTAR domain-containing protein [Paenibacillus piri]